MAAPDPFTPTPLFAFPLFSSAPGGFDAHREGLIREILEHKQRYPGVVRSNRKAWHSGEELLDQVGPHLTWLIAAAMTYGRRALGQYYQDWTTHELHLGSIWANVTGPGGWNAPHHHFPAHWSGVFYIAARGLGSGATDDLAGTIEFLNPTPWQAVWGRSGNFAYVPQEGVILLFPSSLVHFVHPHAGDEDRISVAFNFNVTPKCGT
jgi:uncharacterized protein (TIGR02466 family)